MLMFFDEEVVCVLLRRALRLLRRGPFIQMRHALFLSRRVPYTFHEVWSACFGRGVLRFF